MALDRVLKESMSSIPQCVAGGCVDMQLGMLLALHTTDEQPPEIFDFLAGATTDLFQGGNTVQIENIWKKKRNEPRDNWHYFQEIIVTSENNIHVFMRGKNRPDFAVVYVTKKTANIGMVLAKSRMSIDALEKAV